MTEPVGGRHLAAMTQPEAARALARGTAIVVSGSVEQHGGHLPLGTDAFAALTVAERVAERIDAPILPLSPVGVAPYHMPWPGSLTLRPDTFMRLLFDVCEGLAAAGVSRVIIVNWHEGNTPSIRLGVDQVQQKLPGARGRRRVAHHHQQPVPGRDGVHPRRRDGDGGGAGLSAIPGAPGREDARQPGRRGQRGPCAVPATGHLPGDA